MTEIERSEVLNQLRSRGLPNPRYREGDNTFFLCEAGKRNAKREFFLKEDSARIGFFGCDYRIMRQWADQEINDFVRLNFPDWRYFRQKNADPDGQRAVWFNLEARNIPPNWYNSRQAVIDVAVVLYEKLNQEGVFSDTFNANQYIDINNPDHQGVIVMNERTKEAFRQWLREIKGNTDAQNVQTIGYIENHIARGRCLNVLDEQGQQVQQLEKLIADLAGNFEGWDAFSQDIQGEPNSKDQYKGALKKYIEFAKAVKDGVPPKTPDEAEGKHKEPMEMKQKNLIIFGAPGTGKSRKLESDRVKFFVERYERVTFYPTYSYAQFVGTYKPVMKRCQVRNELGRLVANAGGQPMQREEISYEFVPGPFLRVLVKALNEEPGVDGKKQDWCLVIEEINRANAAAVFGDVFQLLDRKDRVSEYSVVASEDVKKHLKREITTDEGRRFLGVVKKKDDQGNEIDEWDWDSCSLRIPENMYIWATMNSADQGVFPMDTAFKRRWAFEYIGLDKAAGENGEGTWTIGMDDNKFTYKWEDFRKYVNRLLALAKVNEDKLMGPFFVKKPGGDGVIPATEFESKVLMYLWEDAGKMCRRQLFGEIATYSELIDSWKENGVDIFSSSLREKDKVKDKPGRPRSAQKLYEPLAPKAEKEPGQ